MAEDSYQHFKMMGILSIVSSLSNWLIECSPE